MKGCCNHSLHEVFITMFPCTLMMLSCSFTRLPDLHLVDDLLHLFGTATGLKTNIQKSSVSPTQCSEQDLAVVQTYFPFEIQDFPCKYLGLRLSNKMLTSAQLLLLIERIADQLHGWKADLMNRGLVEPHLSSQCSPLSWFIMPLHWSFPLGV
jgi:hypothetical protein